MLFKPKVFVTALLLLRRSARSGEWEGIELQVSLLSEQTVVVSPVAITVQLDFRNGVGADVVRSGPGEWEICYASRGVAGTRGCVGLNVTQMPAIRLRSGSHVIDAWLRRRGAPDATRLALTSIAAQVVEREEVSPIAMDAIDDCRLLLPCELNEVVRLELGSTTIELLYNLRRFFSHQDLLAKIQELHSDICLSSSVPNCLNILRRATMRQLAIRCGCVPISSGLQLHQQNTSSNTTIHTPIPLYYINLARRPERDVYMRSQFRGMDALIRPIRFAAIDGGSHTMTTEQMAHFRTSDFLARAIWTNTAIVRRIMGNLLSHYEVWRALLDSSDPLALVFQDDLELSPDFAKRIVRLSQHALNQGAWVVWLAASQGDTMWLGYPLSTHPDVYSNAIAAHTTSTNAPIGLCDPKTCQPCSGAYILTRAGALALLEYAESRGFEHQSDILMNKILLAHNANWISRPLLATTNRSTFESDVWVGPIQFYPDT